MLEGVDDVLILDAPDLYPLVMGDPLILAPFRHARRLADLLDLPLLSEEIAGTADSAGELTPVPEITGSLLPDAPPRYPAHDKLTGGGVEIPWCYLDRQVHAASPEGLARGLAWAASRRHLRHLLAALLTSPDQAPRLLAEADLDG